MSRRLSYLHRPRPTAFTIVELLIVIAIVGVLVSLLLPAVTATRETARQVKCKSNLRQQALATLAYAESNKNMLPPLWLSEREQPWENSSWRVALLPFLEQRNLFDRFDPSLPPLDSKINLPVAQMRVAIFECPSTPGGSRRIRSLGFGDTAVMDCNVASSDYVAIYDVRLPDRSYPGKGVWNGTSGDLDLEIEPPGPGMENSISSDSAQRRNVRSRSRPASLAAIRDGTSNTLLLIEQAGKPNFHGYHASPSQLEPIEGAWATGEFASFSGEGVNVNNQENPYGFHQAAMSAMCDGSVHLLTVEIAPDVLRALMTSRGREIISENDWR